MDTDSMIAEIDAEIEKLVKVRALLTRTGKGEVVLGSTITKPRKRRQMSKEARTRISEAQRKRWAAHRKAEK